ncbi:glycoside hydrolase family 95 protein-like protein [Lophiotrema nucula]|uniref:Glycoside hydrolase family 95 protein-like protein n=1 Tax=Lophiotrema nucula TaxID=690887 RepID=A0A6A5ZWX1_9PLEO|nr:glycoside hydrolase family 95 protein-like protein [Lophiotrema nucula]
MLLLCGLVLLSSLLPSSTAKQLWSTSPATNYSNIIREAYLLGNGRLGAMPFGALGDEKIVLNVDSLWSGGPFGAVNYTGRNPAEEKSSYLPGVREWIFQNTTGNITELLGNMDDYGSYQVFGNLSVSFEGQTAAENYERRLDLDTGVHTASGSCDTGATYTSTVYCSYPDQVCVYQINSTTTLPSITLRLENQLVNATLANSTCGEGNVRLQGITQVGPPEGMKFDGIARVVGASGNSTSCSSESGTLTVRSTAGLRSLSIVVGAGTNFDQSNGNVASNFSFRGVDPAGEVERVIELAASKSADDLMAGHLEDYQALSGEFLLNLPDHSNSSQMETSELFDNYNSSVGDPFVESLLFDYSRHLLISSSRDNSLPANLQGRWNSELSAAWSADYHANINLQMNYWAAEQTGLGSIQDGLWRYMKENWVPRGTETARLLYDAPGWVVHNEMNIFGHTGMKGLGDASNAIWANYPAAAAWMMQHVTDHFSYSQNLTWLRETGYPLLKGVAEFWLSQLLEDDYWKDGSLVVNPCNSPEHGPTTFGCTHYQQLIHQAFANVAAFGPIVSDSDSTFVQNVSSVLSRLDKGLHFTSWGGVKDWKLPDLEDSTVYDFQNDTHRHLSHLWGWYPGISLVSPSSPYLSGYTNKSIQDAVATSLYSRGLGNGPDANAGWEKVWRSACWARLNNTEQAYFELKYAIEQNFAGNGLSMYSGKEMSFQIDANFGLGGAVLAMLVVDIEESGVDTGDSTVVLGPAIPREWAGGSVKGLRLRGGGSVDFGWDDAGAVTWVRSKAASCCRYCCYHI